MSKLLLAIEVGPRTVAMAQHVVHRVGQRLASGCIPAWLSDGFKGYLPAIVGHFGFWFTRSAATTKARGASRGGCRGLDCSLRRLLSSIGVGAWLE